MPFPPPLPCLLAHLQALANVWDADEEQRGGSSSSSSSSSSPPPSPPSSRPSSSEGQCEAEEEEKDPTHPRMVRRNPRDASEEQTPACSLPEAEWELREAAVAGTLALICVQLRRDPASAATVRSRLRRRRFIPHRRHSHVAPYDIYIDLDADLDRRALAVPPFLARLEPLLSLIGARVTTTEDQPHVYATAPVACHQHDIGAALVQQFNRPDLADTVVSVEGRELYVHRLMLCLTCPYFARLFSSGMNVPQRPPLSTRCKASSVYELTAPEWATYDSMWTLLRFLYGGHVQHVRKGTAFDTAEGDDVAVVCELLRAADHYDLPYVKQWCERFLADDVITVLNVCDLYSHAVGCNATQLQAVCRFHIRKHMAVIAQTDSYAALPQEMRDSMYE
eukprot:TRINITY_DN764_c1_g1_i1.p1 TRINITY_DN764_c1_g1~~TRINITY_DN764_c1_g1_i1.p1  ORF type:complete len:393 (-),score=126.32 TRINITY_DN764_c1_g1_i1:168-1346(-)